MAPLKISRLKSINTSDLKQLAQPYTGVKALKTISESSHTQQRS
jgi:hypothetical protein